jgi:hypothetical protein
LERRRTKQNAQKDDQKHREAETTQAEDWKDSISGGTGEEQGSEHEDDAANSETMLADFLKYIKARKLVSIEELASEFGLKSTDAVDRVRLLEKAISIHVMRIFRFSILFVLVRMGRFQGFWMRGASSFA